MSSALFVATSLVWQAQSMAAGAAGAADAAEAHALIWSGVQVVMSKLNDQRERILSGDLPRLDSQYVVFETPHRWGVARLLALDQQGDRYFSCESGKLDLNSADAAALAKTGMIDPAAAAAIIAHRDQTLHRPFQSIDELLGASGANMNVESLYGPVENITPMQDAQPQARSVGERISDRLRHDDTRGLADVLTVFSCEPQLQSSGKRRINLGNGWSDDLGAKITEQFGQDAATLVKRMLDSGAKFNNQAKIFQTLRAMKSPPEDWPNIVDAFTTSNEVFEFGKLDINTAPVQALLALPGVSDELAAKLVSAREEMSPHEKSTIAWPVIAHVIPPEAIDQIADRITTRCWAYRVRIAAGEVDADQPEGVMNNPVIYEAVFDLSGPTPRIAYFRDITQLQIAAHLAAAAAIPNTPFDRDSPSSDQEPSAQTAPASTAPDTTGHGPQPRPAPTPPPPPLIQDWPSPHSPDSAANTPPLPSDGTSSSASRGRIGRWLSGG